VGWSPDGKRLAIASKDRTVQVWDASPGYAARAPVRPSSNPLRQQETARTYQNLGSLLQELHHREEAERALRDALAIQKKLVAEFPTAASYREDLARTHFLRGKLKGQASGHQAKGDLAGAIAEFHKALALDPKHAPAHNNLGIALATKGDLAGAIAECKKAIALDPKFAPAHYNLGNALTAKGDLAGAIAAYHKAIALNPKHALAHTNLGNVLHKKGDLAGAIAEYNKAIAIDPKFVPAHYNLGIALATKGDLAGAIAAYRQAIRLKKDYPEAHNNLAWLLATCHDTHFRDADQAVRLATKAVELAPNVGNLWNTLGVANYRAGKWKTAIGALEKSMALRKGGDSADWFFLGMAHWQLNEKKKARAWYDKAVQWMEKHQPKNEQLRRFRAEAAKLLGLKDGARK
jgi:tetratricopeptide (TPR) repeat protein